MTGYTVQNVLRGSNSVLYDINFEEAIRHRRSYVINYNRDNHDYSVDYFGLDSNGALAIRKIDFEKFINR